MTIEIKARPNSMRGKRDELENYLLGLGCAFEDATRRLENSCGPVNMVISCNLALEMVSLIEKSEEFKSLKVKV